ncbi:GAF and ANTAR domain-containing protein [Arthrobacter sp. UYCo732]|uniref:GAF and ANTAR domain-containing protein n=1 Tax=Arthrobacter sp. UYCo732 TaxID=3156336 RepID=UPI00339B380B
MWSSGQSPAPKASAISPPTRSGLLLDLRADRDDESLRLLARAAASALSEAAGCALDGAVTLARPGQTPLSAGSADQAEELVKWERAHGDGPVSQALSGRLAIIVNDYSRDARWPGFWGPLRHAGYRSVVSVPLTLEPGCPAALTILAGTSQVFSPGVLARVMAFSKAAASSLLMAAQVRAAMASADHLRTAMNSRTSIDIACGVIMGQNRCSYEEAFSLLAKASSHRNVKVRQVAETVLEALPGGAPATHFQG